MNYSLEKDDDSFLYIGGRESRQTYIANGLCFGFEGWEGCCERDLEPGQELCTRCRELEQAYRDEAEESARRERRWRAGLFTDVEKEEIREGLDSSERFLFDQNCSIADFLEGYRTFLRSHSRFLLAEFREDPKTRDLAAAVMLWRDGRFQTVAEVIDECANHRWNHAVFELWVMETASRIREVIRQLDGVSARALTVYAEYVNFYDPDPDEGLDSNIFHQDEE